MDNNTIQTIIQQLNQSFDIDDPLFLKQIVLLSYYFNNTSDTIDSEIALQFENLQKKCYNILTEVQDENESTIPSQPKNQCCNRPENNKPQRVDMVEMCNIVNNEIDLLTQTIFFPRYRDSLFFDERKFEG